MLGLGQQDLDEGKSQIAHGETVRETANMVSFCAEAVGIRDDINDDDDNTEEAPFTQGAPDGGPTDA